MLSHAMAADPDVTVGWVRLGRRWSTLPSGSASFDAIVAASVLECEQSLAVVRECVRVLRPGSVPLCTVPNPAEPVRWLEWLVGQVPKHRLPEPRPALRPGCANA